MQFAFQSLFNNVLVVSASSEELDQVDFWPASRPEGGCHDQVMSVSASKTSVHVEVSMRALCLRSATLDWATTGMRPCRGVGGVSFRGTTFRVEPTMNWDTPMPEDHA